MLKRNIVSNIAGGVWVAALTVAITPLQIHLLGMEAFGVIGFIATLQVALGVFDLGLSATLIRELAGDQSDGRQATIKLVQTAKSIYWALALVFGFILFLFLGQYADSWFNAQKLDIAAMTTGMSVAAVFLALRWPVAFYSGILSGIQRMDVLNIVKVGAVSVRLFGGIGVLLLWSDLAKFLIWLAISALIEVLMYAYACKKYFPAMPKGYRVYKNEFLRVWRYTLSMNVIAILSLLLTQTDRLIVSKMLELETLGHYMLAYTAASAILIVQLGIASAMFPAYTDAFEKKGREGLANRYNRATQVTLFMVGFIAFPLVFFGEPILTLWVSAEAASSSWHILALLALGFYFSAASTNAYNVAIACHLPNLPLKINLYMIVPYLFTLYFSILWAGAEGAAIIWILLNVLYVVTLVPIVHKKILGLSYMKWLMGVLIRFLCIGAGVFGLIRTVSQITLPEMDGFYTNVASFVLLCLSILTYSMAGFFALDKNIRLELIGIFNKFFAAAFYREESR